MRSRTYKLLITALMVLGAIGVISLVFMVKDYDLLVEYFVDDGLLVIVGFLTALSFLSFVAGVFYLLKYYNVNKIDADGLTPLYCAATSGDTEEVKPLLAQEETDINQFGGYANLTLLIWAIEKRNTAMGYANLTPLIWAIEKRNTAIAKLLIQSAEIDVNKSGGYANLTPLIWAIEKRNTAIAKLLIQSAEIDVNKSGGYANQTPLIFAMVKGNIEIIELLLKNPNIAVNANSYGQTLLCLAIQKGKKGIIKLLLEHKNIDVNLYGGYINQTPLIWAIKTGNTAIIKLLLHRAEIEVNKAYKSGNTPLILAIEKGDIEIIKLLIHRAEIEVNKADKSGNTPLILAIEKGNTAIAKLLLKHENIEVNKADKSGNTPLIWVIRARNVEIVKLLVDFPEIYFNKAGKYGKTPLTWAIEKGNIEILELLLNNLNIDVNKAYESGKTPLIWAIEKGNTAIAKLLLKHENIEVNKEDPYENTPLSLAIEKGNTEIVELLLNDSNIGVNDYHRLSMAVYSLLLRSRSTEETVNCFNCVDRIMSHRDVEVPLFRITFDAHYSLTHRHLVAPKILRDFVYFSDYSQFPDSSRLIMLKYALANPAMMSVLCLKIKLFSIKRLHCDIDGNNFNQEQESLLILFSHVDAIGEEVDKVEIGIILKFLAERIDNWLIKDFVLVGPVNPSYSIMVNGIIDEAGFVGDKKAYIRACFESLPSTIVSLLYKFHNANILEYQKQLPYPLDGFPKLKLKLDPGKRELQKFFNYIASTVFSLPEDVFYSVGGFLGVNEVAEFTRVCCTSAKFIISIVTKSRELSLLEVKAKTVNLGQITSKEGNGQAIEAQVCSAAHTQGERVKSGAGARIILSQAS